MKWTSATTPIDVGGIQALIELNLDSAMGFRQAAEQLSSPVISHTFRVNANTREMFARHLETLANANGVRPRMEGTPTATLHRWWLGVRASLGSEQDVSILREIQFDEEHVKMRYEEILTERLDPHVREFLREQYESVCRALLRIQSFRNELSPL